MGKSRSARREALLLSQYPLLLVDTPPVRIAEKPLASMMQSEIDAMLKPTEFSASRHFVQRISQQEGRNRWQSLGINNVHDLWLCLRSAYRSPETRPESDESGRLAEAWSLEQGAAVLIVNPESKLIATITFL